MPAININDVILKVSSRISDTVNGDTVLLIEQNIPTSIYRITKRIAELKPKGHEYLLKTYADVSVNSAAGLTEYSGYTKFNLSTLEPSMVVGQYFHSFFVSNGSTKKKAFPMNSMAALGLAETHNKICYFIQYPDVYVKCPSTFAGATGTITHYAYLAPKDFPVELEDFLVDDLVMLLQGEAQKQAVEEAKGHA